MTPARLLSSIALALWLSWGLPAAAQAQAQRGQAQGGACPAFDRPTLTVDFRNTPVQRDYGRTMRQLASLPGRAPGPAGARKGSDLGLAQTNFAALPEVGITFQPQGGGVVCGALSTVKITVSAQDRMVYVARELPRGSCIHAEVLKHEMRHVAVDEALIEEFRTKIKRRLQTVVERVGTRRARTGQQLHTMLRQPVERELTRLLNDFSRERERRQARIDTIQEYERVSRSCNGELMKYMEGQPGF